MPMPSLTQRQSEIYFTVTENTKKLFQTIYREQNKIDNEDENVPRIKVSSLVSKMAFYYEKIRNSVDYKEEHLLRKNAILRILKRHIVIQGAISFPKSEEMSKHLMAELIRAGYLPNNKLPETKIGEIAQVIDKYVKLRKEALSNFNSAQIGTQSRFSDSANLLTAKNDISLWIISLAACEIEEKLGRSMVTQMVISNMYEVLNHTIELTPDSPHKKDKEIQIYIGIHRNLLKFDRDMVGFILFKYFNANWAQASDAEISAIGKNILLLEKAIQDQTDHPLANKLNVIISRYTLFFSILKDVIEDDPVGVYDSFKADPKAFPRQIKKICNQRYKQAKSKLWRAAIRSIIYIFITKSVFAVILEVPATQFLHEPLNMVSLGINISFPAILLFFIVLFTRMPGDSNTAKIVAGVEQIVFVEKERQDPIRMREPAKRSRSLQTVFGLVYFIMYFVSLGLVVSGLEKIGFNWVSIIIFLFFLTFVSFFSFRIRKGIKEYMITDSSESFLGFLLDFLYTPIVSIGKWLSERFSRINVFVFILDFIIEAPFKIFVEVAEEWTKYVKERKEEIV